MNGGRAPFFNKESINLSTKVGGRPAFTLLYYVKKKGKGGK